MAKAIRLLFRFESGRPANAKTRTTMKWIHEPIPGCAGYTEEMIALKPREATILSKALRRPLREFRKRLELLNDIHESGEATERQETRRFDLDDIVSTIERFIELESFM